MSDYISRKDVLAVLFGLLKDIKETPIGNGEDAYKDGIWQGEKSCAIEAFLRIKAIPAEDVKPVVRGEWKHLSGDEWMCSNCGYVVSTEGSWEYPLEIGKDYCEHCGADMREEEE